MCIRDSYREFTGGPFFETQCSMYSAQSRSLWGYSTNKKNITVFVQLGGMTENNIVVTVEVTVTGIYGCTEPCIVNIV